ncbi:plastocyanin/azurin family copper-binding protein [Chondrinema litorale]|uniref:plastocyanin/azurin family copper-binding protein n=1 Tax=Chondrinema litorale TaxID=2994555 RepID=UPI002542AB0F|nr:plastocyanin/azurin family copper-binding protein [Chondrinema litorale]UZR92703.1 plastocyanin/azurin family copper-binding protein [Chondrinema litorale]
MSGKHTNKLTASFRFKSVLSFAIIALFFLVAARNINLDVQKDDFREIRIKAIAGLKYDIVRFAVKPGEKIRIIFENTDDMAHNMVFTRPGKRESVVREAQMMGGSGAAKNYIPESEDVLWNTKILEIEDTQTLEFTAPEEEAVYPYACTYPGHGFVMYGAMYVTTDALPPLETDENIPENQRTSEFQEELASPHPYLMTYPMFYRTFMPECSPAAIAVAMSAKHSYCWDATNCMLRYSWKGGFVDNTAHWKGNGNAFSEIKGDIYFKRSNQFPFSIGAPDSLMMPDFNGYQIDKQGFPQFNYTLGKVMFREKVLPLTEDAGIKIQYETSHADEPLYFRLPQDKTVTVQVDKGVEEGGIIKLSPEEAKLFSVTFTSIHQQHHQH